MKITIQLLRHIAEKYYDEIYKYCFNHVNSEHDAYDLTQEVFLALGSSFETIEYKYIRQWLYSTAHNIVVDYYKHKRRDTENVIPLDEALDKVESVPDTSDEISDEDNIDEEETEKYKSMILEKLTPTERRLYDEAFVRKTSYGDIAAMYGINETALRKRISRLRIKIIKIVKKLLYQ